MSKIVLGTVQFGVNYGINNTNGQGPLEEVCKILEIAYDNGEKKSGDTKDYYYWKKRHYPINRVNDNAKEKSIVKFKD